MKIAILGAGGFIGKALADHLASHGEQVARIGRPEFELTDPTTFASIPADAEVLVHAAGSVGNGGVELRKVNVESAYYLGKYLSQNSKASAVVYLSSGAVFGQWSKGRLTCSSRLKPIGSYAISKLLAEELLGHWLRQRNFIRLRLFFPFGPGQRPPRLIPGLIKRIAAEETVVLNTDDGRPFINPIHVNDLVRQIYRIVQSPVDDCYNLGGAATYSIREIAEKIGKHLQKEVKFSVRHNDVGNIVCEPAFADEADFDAQLAETIARADYI